jgi:hypothetical protein
MRNVARWLLVLLAAGGATPAYAEQFRYRLRPGQVVQNRASLAGATMMGPSGGSMVKMQFRAAIRQTLRVRSVIGGVATLEIKETPISGKVTAFGQTEPYNQPTRTLLVKLTERGRVISRKEISKSSDNSTVQGMDGTDALYGLNFPDRELKPGDSWEDTLTLGEQGASQAVRMASKYLGRAVFRGRNCAKFTTTLTMPLSMGEESSGEDAAGAAGTLTANVTTYFDPQAGVEVYSRGSFVITARADISGISTDAGELVTATKINFIQSLVSGQGKK